MADAVVTGDVNCYNSILPTPIRSVFCGDNQQGVTYFWTAKQPLVCEDAYP